MTTTTGSTSARVRASLDHPIIDGDSHIVEFMPTFFDYLKDVGGSDMVKRYRDSSLSRRWAAMSWDERRAERTTVPPWWALPTENTLDRATAMLPRLLQQRMDEVGMVSSGYETLIRRNGWAMLGPAAAILLMVVAFNFVGDGVRDAFDPRLRNIR